MDAMEAMDKVAEELENTLKELFDECNVNNGIYRSMAEHIGVLDSNAIVEALLETGLKEDQRVLPR